MNGYFYDLFLYPVEKLHLEDLRSQLLSLVHDKTLEIGAGTGLNFTHYPTETKLTAIDSDESMISKAKKRRNSLDIEYN
jgi:ubiquinone/menaquinone biosynthesis C-methylase UbiE